MISMIKATCFFFYQIKCDIIVVLLLLLLHIQHTSRVILNFTNWKIYNFDKLYKFLFLMLHMFTMLWTVHNTTFARLEICNHQCKMWTFPFYVFVVSLMMTIIICQKMVLALWNKVFFFFWTEYTAFLVTMWTQQGWINLRQHVGLTCHITGA